MVPLKMFVGALVAALSCTALAQTTEVPEPDSAAMYRPVQESAMAPAVLPNSANSNTDDHVFLQLRDAVRQNDTNKAAALAARLAEAMREVTRLRCAVECVAPGSLANDGRVIEDARSYQ